MTANIDLEVQTEDVVVLTVDEATINTKNHILAKEKIMAEILTMIPQ
jgi:hypothetical protein